MLGFELDFWDYVTFATAGLAGFAGVMTYIWIAGLPGRIALARKHPEAEAVKIMGWAGLLPTILPWIQAFIWAAWSPPSWAPAGTAIAAAAPRQIIMRRIMCRNSFLTCFPGPRPCAGPRNSPS